MNIQFSPIFSCYLFRVFPFSFGCCWFRFSYFLFVFNCIQEIFRFLLLLFFFFFFYCGENESSTCSAFMLNTYNLQSKMNGEKREKTSKTNRKRERQKHTHTSRLCCMFLLLFLIVLCNFYVVLLRMHTLFIRNRKNLNMHWNIGRNCAESIRMKCVSIYPSISI